MRKLLFYVLGISVLGCTSIANIEPNQKNSFLKFYAETNQMDAQDLLVLDDGYLIIATYSQTNSLLLKTDAQGNKLWADSLGNFLAHSISIVSDGYIIAGQGINTQTANQSYMQLIKADLTDGAILATVATGNGNQTGTAVTANDTNDIYALGYSTNDSIIVQNYTSDLTLQWQRNYASTSSAKTIIEQQGFVHFLHYTNTASALSLKFAQTSDSESPVTDQPLFNGATILNTNAELTETSSGFAVCQTLQQNTSESKIGIAFLNNGVLTSENVLNDGAFAEGNYTSGALVNTGNSLLLAYATDLHADGGRSDFDLGLIELNYDGTPTELGFSLNYGGIGNELPVRVRKTNDGGYIILGNSINSKGARQVFVLKTTSNGLLEE